MLHILTLSWNGLDKLERLRPGLEDNIKYLSSDLPYKWYIRDNGSQDGTVEKIKTWKNVEVLPMDHNRDNFSQGMNSLAEIANKNSIVIKSRAVGATTELVQNIERYLFLNNDIIFNDKYSLKKMWSLLDRPSVGIVGARLLYPNSNKLQHAGVIFSKRYNDMPWHFRRGEEFNTHSMKNRYFQAVTGACLLVKAHLFKTVNGLDNLYGWSFEDIDFCLKIKQLGFQVAYCGETNISHEESASLKKNNYNKLYLNKNVVYFKQKWSGKYDLDLEKYEADPNYMLIK